MEETWIVAVSNQPVLYTLQYIQAIAVLSIKLSPEEREAWKTSRALDKNTWNGEKTWEAILSFVISKLSKGRSVYEADTEEMSVLSSSVWSQQSIEYNLQQFCLPFLRLCSLLQHHLYGDDLPGCPREKEFSVLASGLGLLSSTLALCDCMRVLVDPCGGSGVHWLSGGIYADSVEIGQAVSWPWITYVVCSRQSNGVPGKLFNTRSGLKCHYGYEGKGDRDDNFYSLVKKDAF
ncbi:hypothetical protein ANANG_G00185930 [Anguilla anguilla]|uniref:E3 ubiquitin-protein ligase n=1 Tax=Anguilla anguilla TaxID=7936 RepID=A0A9D3M653_ANGAN|nr:hypothetical protein ANANG_G00185930 [Anguilla anguilla]